MLRLNPALVVPLDSRDPSEADPDLDQPLAGLLGVRVGDRGPLVVLEIELSFRSARPEATAEAHRGVDPSERSSHDRPAAAEPVLIGSGAVFGGAQSSFDRLIGKSALGH